MNTSPLRPIRLFALGTLTLLFLISTAALASQGRVSGTVRDADGSAIVDAKVTVTGLDRTSEDTYTTNKKGRFRAVVVDATLDYSISIEKEGYRTLEQALDIGPGNNTLDFVLEPGQGSPAGGSTAAAGGTTDGPTQEVADIFNAGASAANTGDLATARMKFEEALALDPELTIAHKALAGIYMEAEELDKAARSAELALAAEPTDARLLNIAYEAELGLGNEAEAAALLERIKASGGGADLAVAVFNEGVEATQAGDLTTAVGKFAAALEMNPNLVNAYAALARIHLSEGNYAEAAANAEIWLERQPGLIPALQVRWDAYRLQGDEAKAQMALEEFISANGIMAAKHLTDLALQAHGTNAFEQASDLARQVLDFQPSYARAHYVLGLSLVAQRDYEQAKEHLRKFAELAPADPDAAGAIEMADSL